MKSGYATSVLICCFLLISLVTSTRVVPPSPVSHRRRVPKNAKNAITADQVNKILKNGASPKQASSNSFLSVRGAAGGSCSSLNKIFTALSSVDSCVLEACGSSQGSGCSSLAQEFSGASNDWSCGALSACSGSNNGGKSDAMIGTYLPNWFVYRKHYMGIENIGADPEKDVGDPTDADQQYCYFGSDMKNIAPKITHIYYAFYNLDKNCKVRDADPAASWWYGATDPVWIHNPSGACKGLLNQLMSLKTEYPHLNVLISVGGWTYSRYFSKCASDKTTRDVMYQTFSFYASAMDENWGKSNGRIAGIDFDWEHPAVADGLYPDHTDNDWQNYVSLLKEFREHAKAEGRNAVQLSAAVGVGGTLKRLVEEFPDAGKEFCKNIDHLNLMTYDLHGKWVKTTGHNAQFCRDDNPDARPEQSLKWSVKEVTEKIGQVCDLKKVMLGLPNYAPAWTDIPDNGVNGLYQNSTNEKSFAQWSTFSDSDKKLVAQGQIHYWDMKQTMQKYSDIQVYTSHTCNDMGVSVPVKYVYSKSKKVFASYEPADVIQAKTQWAKAKGLGGFFFWDASQDKQGETLDAARAGWSGLSTKSASGSAQCYDSNEPDFTVEPDTGKAAYDGCYTNVTKTYKVVAGDTCSAIKSKLDAKCTETGSAIMMGGTRAGATDCKCVCAYNFDAGKDALQAQDTLYYVCSDEEFHNGGGGGGGDGDGDGDDDEESFDCTSDKTITVGAGGSCSAIGSQASAACGGQAYFAGATRVAASTTCEATCSETWGAGTAALWTGDVVHYTCDSNGGGGGGNGGKDSNDLPPSDGIGTDCKTCGTCVAAKNPQQIFDSDCAQCTTGITWWPCNVQGACHCA